MVESSDWLVRNTAAAQVFKHDCLVALDHLEPRAAEEYQVTVLLTCDTASEENERGFDVYTFVQGLPFLEATVAVEAHLAERLNPTVKDVQWVKDRQHLEEIQRQAGVNEVLMYDEAGCVTEGLQTNFFAALGGVLYTAPEDRVLPGTVRKVVIEVARSHGIEVKLECPNIADLNRWESCFICSTSRLVPRHSSKRGHDLPCVKSRSSSVHPPKDVYIYILYVLYNRKTWVLAGFWVGPVKVKPIHKLTASESRHFEPGLAERLAALVLEAVQRHAEPLT